MTSSRAEVRDIQERLFLASPFCFLIKHYKRWDGIWHRLWVRIVTKAGRADVSEQRPTTDRALNIIGDWIWSFYWYWLDKGFVIVGFQVFKLTFMASGGSIIERALYLRMQVPIYPLPGQQPQHPWGRCLESCPLPFPQSSRSRLMLQ